MTQPFDSSADTGAEKGGSSSTGIDWSALRPAVDRRQLSVEIDIPRDSAVGVDRSEAAVDPLSAQRDPLDADRALTVELEVDVPRDEVAELDSRDTAADRLLSENEPLDPARRGVPVAELHPDRLTPATPDQVDDLTRAWDRRDQLGYAWVEKINPGRYDDELAGRVGRNANCADCARSVQATLEGRPTIAAAIDERGLPFAGQADAGGEVIEYTEQWAGRRAEDTDYSDIEKRLMMTKGSAIVYLEYARDAPLVDRADHLTNAVYDARSNSVLWIDGQIGKVDKWPPPFSVVVDYPRAPRAIFFD